METQDWIDEFTVNAVFHQEEVNPEAHRDGLIALSAFYENPKGLDALEAYRKFKQRLKAIQAHERFIATVTANIPILKKCFEELVRDAPKDVEEFANQMDAGSILNATHCLEEVIESLLNIIE